ncbi:hypothetical protein GCM10017691_13260 [Pseudonocardia petroleophila]|uniref:PPE domain-containing protein n=1 Tax=Pseudonocardia petroleophila TaxID=37331 RepID=A0A7G7MIF0_9PSEU|nr:PPE domain-containing protein [Pseudonocardia petroleophila]QNG52561.1 PPE domain-containing protein [Pseudonocardia petroleophila]
MTAPNPLIVEAENEDAQPLDNWEGAGAASSVADMNAAWARDDPDLLQIGFTTAGAALDGLDAVMHPLDALATSAVGWLIEHVWWLHEPLDALAGDPTQIKAQAQTWHSVGAQLSAVAAGYRSELAGGSPDWEGAAADAYRAAVTDYATRLDDVAAMAERLSSVILVSGAGVAAMRSWIRDRIAEFVWLVLQLLLWSGVLAFLTAGGSLAAAAVQAIVRAERLARSFVRQISRLLDTLDASGRTAHQLVSAMRDTVAQVRAAAPLLHTTGEGVLSGADAVRAAEVIETGKQLTNSAQDRRNWDTPSPG